MPRNIDYAKRRRIMQRSRALGHCICDPRKPCPCDVFTEQGICPCAGERPDPIALDAVKLTEMVHNAGCASKIAPADLEGVLGRLPAVEDPAVLCGMPAGDDAGVYRLPDGSCLVQTVDVMTPCVDDPVQFGRICAANCLSDIYAMGGEPKTALSVLAFPAETHDGQIMYLMMKGAMEVFAEAGVALIGGHSVKDEEIKLGFAITGLISPDAVARNDAAAVGDVLVLTKPLGAGVLNFSRQIGRVAPGLADMEASMARLNREAAAAMAEVGVSACTDVTGFGLYGHLIIMARHSKVEVQVSADCLPSFAGAVNALADGVIPGAVERNREFVADDIACSPAVGLGEFLLGFDAQTSGGLLMAVSEERLPSLKAALQQRGEACHVIGRVVADGAGMIRVTREGEASEAAVEVGHEEPVPPAGMSGSCCSGSQEATAGSCCEELKMPQPPEPCCTTSPAPAEASCCSAAGEASGGTSAESQRAFGALMRSAGAGGKIDERSKELIQFALVLMGRCESCFRVHYDKAREMGISAEELEEAAWLATAMGGVVVRMFYREMLAKVDQADGSSPSCCG